MGSALKLENLKTREEPRSIILVEPEFFQVVDQKNPYMDGAIDFDLAQKQWKEMLNIYRQLVLEGILESVSVIKGAPGLEDMVFCANQSLPWLDSSGHKQVVLSNMRYPSRREEITHFNEFYASKGYEVRRLPSSMLLEGMGDCIFHPNKALLWMGYGYRTSAEMRPLLEEALEMPVISLKLVNEYFYHLDTCFLPVSDRKVMLCKEAFDPESMDKIRSVFDEIVEVDRAEAINTFCLNTHCIYTQENPVAITPAGDHTVKKVLQQEGYRVLEVDTSEFIKSGGSVYCMKMMYYE